MPLPKLGKLAPKIDHRTLRLAKYLGKLPPPPASIDHSMGITDWKMMENDQLGDCTIAAVGHAIQVFTVNTTGIVTVPDSTVVHYYSLWDGYIPGQPDTDQGGVELDVLDHWRKEGFDGHNLLAYASIAPRNLTHIKQAIALFGGVYIGVTLPVSAQNQTEWDLVSNDGGVWGGHAVFCHSYDETTISCITWGQNLKISIPFFATYVDESYGLLAGDWTSHFYTGVDMTALMNDLNAVTG